jgi:hypothetical protein
VSAIVLGSMDLNFIKKLIEILAATLAPVTAILAILIAWRQVRLERLRWRHAMYEKRLALFNSTMELLAHIISGNPDMARLQKFLVDTDQSYFLLGKNLHNYLFNLYVKGIELQSLREKLDHTDGKERECVAKAKCKLLIWFGKQIEVARKKFAKHLSLDA